MSTKCKLTIAVPVALVVLMCLISAAYAEPTRWANNRVAIPAGETVELGVSGTMTLRTMTTNRRVLLYAKCTVTSTETLFNKNEHGQGEVKTIAFTGCTDETAGRCAGSAIEVEPMGTPWPTILEASPTFYLDEWHNVALDIRCGSTDLGISTGTLTPKIGDVDDVGNFMDDVDDHLIFGPKYGTLTEPGTGNTTVIIFGEPLIEGKRIQAWRFPGGAMTRFTSELD